MSVTIQLDRPHAHFTNLDFLSGKVVLNLLSETPIEGIQVKLEGESRTRLSGPRHPHHEQSDKKRTELEVHKLLYKVESVFPTPGVLNQSPGTTYTFAAGTYEYPFQFKFPFNNACSMHNSMLTNLNITGLKVEVARDTNRHVKKTLPPSLSGFPGEADIKYYVKVTVIRPEFYRENIREITNFNFLPIEPPRIGDANEETYARRQSQFAKPTPSKAKGLFQKISSSSLRDSEAQLPRVSVDLRLPNPPILTCNEPIPLRVLVSKASETYETIFLQMLQIDLISYTHILAHDLRRTEPGSWVIFSRSNMGIPLGRGGDPVGTEWALDSNLWNRIPLPSSVAPTFETCNISRSYELEVRVGLTYGSIGSMRPQLIVLPLRMPVKVYSGIAPPKALLDTMAATGRVKPTVPPRTPTRTDHDGPSGRPAMPPRPSAQPVPVNSEEANDEAPPSYEDAMAETLSPVDGPRREYNPPDTSSRPVEPGADRRPSGHAAKESEARSPYGNPGANNSSAESFDMLPSTPPEPQSNSPPTSPVARQQSILKIHKVAPPEDSPPQYQTIAEDGTQRPPSSRQRPSRGDIRAMNLGVPSRKPVPRSPSGRHAS
ncbi:hypothetical protein BDW42DRAFT_170641 [Aspergillus taichungensis]|uniref:Arrestin-like N-terminal domain-containing protein n=1 Tax=Aspergillus taichungensis TaxID=482145 RepID=A0A2J5HTF4_9EURO|nr:hypothetical protein BDW42DRAFT_170641 [Aspergillus taichungensis]